MVDIIGIGDKAFVFIFYIPDVINFFENEVRLIGVVWGESNGSNLIGFFKGEGILCDLVSRIWIFPKDPTDEKGTD